MQVKLLSHKCEYNIHGSVVFIVLTWNSTSFSLCIRYAELLAQSTSCALRRSSGVSLLIRPRTPFVRDNPRRKRKQKLRHVKFLTQTTTSELLVEEERELHDELGRCPPVPLGSGTLGHMEALDLSTRYPDTGFPHPAAASSSAAVEAFGRSFDDPHSLVDEVDDVSVWTTLDLPSSELVSYMRGLADQRDQQQLSATAEINDFLREVDDDDDDNDSDDQQEKQKAPPPPRLCLENSAAIAVSMLVEELLRDFMKSWGERGVNQARTNKALQVGPLSNLSKRTLRAAARLQIQGCSSSLSSPPGNFSPESKNKSPNSKSNSAVRLQHVLRNRLEVTTTFIESE